MQQIIPELNFSLTVKCFSVFLGGIFCSSLSVAQLYSFIASLHLCSLPITLFYPGGIFVSPLLIIPQAKKLFISKQPDFESKEFANNP